VQGKDVREVLTQVALGNVDAGWSIAPMPQQHPGAHRESGAQRFAPVHQLPDGGLTSTRNGATARGFLSFLQTSSAKAI
jgi:ABC-type molybdate transport system substrate-binding protein